MCPPVGPESPLCRGLPAEVVEQTSFGTESRGLLAPLRVQAAIRRHGRRLYSHSTSGMVTDEGKRQLLELVSAIDRTHLNGTLQRAQTLFRCGNTSFTGAAASW